MSNDIVTSPSEKSLAFHARLLCERFPTPADAAEREQFLADQVLGLTQRDVSANIEQLIARPPIATPEWMRDRITELALEIEELTNAPFTIEPANAANRAMNQIAELDRKAKSLAYAPVREAAAQRLDALAHATV